MLTLISDCDMMIMLGRSEKECPFFVPLTRMVRVRIRKKNVKVERPQWRSHSLRTKERDDPPSHHPKGNKKEAAPQPDPTYHITPPTALRTVCPRRLAAGNDPWRFRQQSSRVISIQFWYLTSLFTSLSVGSDTGFKMASDKTCKLGGFLPMSVLALIILGA